MTLLTKTFLIPLFSLDPVDRHVEQPVEHAVGHLALPRDLGRQGARRQVAVEALPYYGIHFAFRSTGAVGETIWDPFQGSLTHLGAPKPDSGHSGADFDLP